MDVWNVVFQKVTDPNTLILVAIIAYLLKQNNKLTGKLFEFHASLTELLTLVKIMMERDRAGKV